MKKQNITHNVQDLWERSIERAVEENKSPQELTNEKLGEAAGVHIKSGIEAAGLWGTTSCTCQSGCSVGIC